VTLDSYGFGEKLSLVPVAQSQFLEQCCLFYKTNTRFVHAGYDPRLPLAAQDSKKRLWLDLNDELPEPHCNGKIAVVGQTAQMNGQVLNPPHLKCIDTGCGYGGLLTALEFTSGQLWQVDEHGTAAARHGDGR
jgi:serine/threonine protein phosphatase 1